MVTRASHDDPMEDRPGSTTPSAVEISEVVAQTSGASLPPPNEPVSIATAHSNVNASDVDMTRPSSQPMVKSASSESEPANSGKDAAGTDTASPYGTRSRNRTGTSRPNYAEDKDIDVEMFDSYHDKKEADSKKSSRLTNQPTSEDAPRSNGQSRRPAPSDEGKLVATQNGSKDVPSTTVAITSNASSNPSGGAQPSKKRKAAAQSSVTTSQSHTPAPVSSATTGSARRTAITSQGVSSSPDTNMLTFGSCGGHPQEGALIADDGTALRPNDSVYLVCEPPGEPYYLGRIMEFLHMQNDDSKPVDALRINWFYRPKDIGKKVNDTRLVFATMHSDISPLTALRGKCQIKHKAEIPRLDEHRKTPDCFWYEKLYDRYIQKNYDLIPTSQIVNVPEKVKQVLDERWKFIIVEQGRGKEFTSAVKLCKRCIGYCASNDSVDCAVCKNTYHMNCVRPPLLKKPSRGFAWSCAACSRAQERKLEARHTPNLADPYGDAEEDEFLDEEEEDLQEGDTGRTSPADNGQPHHHGTAEQVYQASLWPWRYLGMHCKPEDALDYDDRIYPRASTRVGPRHQAVVLPWPGRPVEYLKPLEYKRNGKKDSKSREAHAAFEAEKARREKLPKWIQDEPAGYVARGEDLDEDNPNSTSVLLWKPPPTLDASQDADTMLDRYLQKAGDMAPEFGLKAKSTNLRTAAIETYYRNDYSEGQALDELSGLDKAMLKEPQLTPAELKKFEEAVTKYGSELQLVTRHVKSVPYGSIVRFYYVWKKTAAGKQIWGHYQNRKSKKEAKKVEADASKLQDDIADDGDDSAFDAGKAASKKRSFICKFCNTKSSRQWRRAPNVSNALIVEGNGKTSQKDKGPQPIQALCRRCAELWRRYAIQWEDLEEVAKKVAQAGGRAWKRRQDEELLKELLTANQLQSIYGTPEPTQPPPVTPASNGPALGEPPRKKLKGIPDKDLDQPASDSGASVPPKKKEKPVEKPAPPPVPEIPKPRVMPCAICDQLEPLGDQHLSCRECRMTVHRNCYGVIDHRSTGKWTCDMCINDKNPQVSIHYKCVLCPVVHTDHDFVELPKPSTSKKKTEKDKERERLERELALKAADFYKKKQEELNRPVTPREPLKRTADNNWVHVTCAVWTPEVKFENPKAFSPSEGVPSIPRARYDEVCKACGHKGGACVACHHCRAPVHVECARQMGFLLGFDISPVKGSRRDQHSIVTINGESGAMSAAIWCKEHAPTKTIVHRMHDIVNEEGQNALQLYVQSCKQADLTLTGTVRKANLIANAAKTSITPLATALRRPPTAAASVNGTTNHTLHDAVAIQNLGDKICITCGIDISPKWWPIDNTDERQLTNGHYGTLGTEAQKFIEQRRFQCHKCRKARRKPNPHPPKEQSPYIEPPRSIPAVMPLVSAQLSAMTSPIAETRNPSAPYAWVAPAAPTGPIQHTSPPAPPALTPNAPPIHMPTPAHHPPPMPSASYGLPGPRYPDWHGRPPTQHGSPPQVVNGGPPPIQPPSLTNMSSLRPPPLAISPAAPMPAAVSNGHHGPPMHAGMPPSPRRMDNQIPLQHGTPYMHAYHGHPTQGMPNGGPPPQAPPPSHPRGTDSFAQGLLPQRGTYATPHGSPPGPRMARDSREPQGPLSAPTMRPTEPPKPAGASTSPSLRNLLS